MYLVLIVLMLICILIGYSFGQNNSSYYEEEMSDKEYEFRFISLVTQIDSSTNITWIGQALDLLKGDYRHYHENPRAMSTLDLLQEAVNDDDSVMYNFIRSCGRMNV